MSPHYTQQAELYRAETTGLSTKSGQLHQHFKHNLQLFAFRTEGVNRNV
jgi:hypothetical protein